MRPGTKSLLFGEHQFLLHPLYVAWAWRHLFGFPWDPRLWLCFLVHDWGYWGREDMDGESGREHPECGARLAHRLLDVVESSEFDWHVSWQHVWYDFCLYHSRYLAERAGHPVSRLALADKMSFVLMPWWIYLPLAWLSGSLREYMANGRRMGEPTVGRREWHRALRDKTLEWIARTFGSPAGVYKHGHYYWSWKKGSDGMASD